MRGKLAGARQFSIPIQDLYHHRLLARFQSLGSRKRGQRLPECDASGIAIADPAESVAEKPIGFGHCHPRRHWIARPHVARQAQCAPRGRNRGLWIPAAQPQFRGQHHPVAFKCSPEGDLRLSGKQLIDDFARSGQMLGRKQPVALCQHDPRHPQFGLGGIFQPAAILGLALNQRRRGSHRIARLGGGRVQVTC